MPKKGRYVIHTPEAPDPDAAVIAGTRGFTPEALRLFLDCSRQIALGLSHALSGWWRRDDPVQAGFAERMLVQVELEKAREVAEILRARLGRFPARHRKHYTPEERLRIVVLPTFAACSGCSCTSWSLCSTCSPGFRWQRRCSRASRRRSRCSRCSIKR